MIGRVKNVVQGFFFVESGGEDYFSVFADKSGGRVHRGSIVEFEAENETTKRLKHAVNVRIIEE